MFSSSSKKKETPEAITTILGEGTEVTGDLVFKGSMRIDGQFDGQPHRRSFDHQCQRQGCW